LTAKGTGSTVGTLLLTSPVSRAACPGAVTHAPIVDAAVTAALRLIIPTFRDESSLDGLERMAEHLTHPFRGASPHLELLDVGVLGFPTCGSDTRDVRADPVVRIVRQREIGHGEPVMPTGLSSRTFAGVSSRVRRLAADEVDERACGGASQHPTSDVTSSRDSPPMTHRCAVETRDGRGDHTRPWVVSTATMSSVVSMPALSRSGVR
jgi:hypothetical protein